MSSLSTTPQLWCAPEPPKPLPMIGDKPACGTCFSRGKLTEGKHLVGESHMCSQCFSGTDEWTEKNRKEAYFQTCEQKRAVALANLALGREARERSLVERRAERAAARSRVRAEREKQHSTAPTMTAIELVAALIGANPDSLMKRDTSRIISRPRYLAFRVAHELFGSPMTVIGRAMHKHHTSVMTGIRRARQIPELIEQFEAIKAKMAEGDDAHA